MPARLKRSIEMGSLFTTVTYYNNTVGILKEYISIPSFKAIFDECEFIVSDLRKALRERVSDSQHYDLTEMSEAASHLIKLGEDTKLLSRTFLGAREKILLAKLEKASKIEP